jgi:hypothetical protein
MRAGLPGDVHSGRLVIVGGQARRGIVLGTGSTAKGQMMAESDGRGSGRSRGVPSGQ